MRSVSALPVVGVDDNISIQQDHGSRVSFRSSSHLILGTDFQFLIALMTPALVTFFVFGRRYSRVRIRSLPFFSQANTSPGAASGSTMRFLLSAVTVIGGMIPRDLTDVKQLLPRVADSHFSCHSSRLMV